MRYALISREVKSFIELLTKTNHACYLLIENL